MIRYRTILPLIVAAIFGATAMMPTKCEAAFQIQITTPSSGGTVVIPDNVAGVPAPGPFGDFSPLANFISFAYSDASYSVIGSAALTNVPGTPSAAVLDITYTISTLTGGTGGAATLTAVASGFTQPNSPLDTLRSTLNGNGTGTGTLALFQFANETGAPQINVPNIGVIGGYSGTTIVTFNGTGGFTLTDRLNFNLPAGAITTGDANSTVTGTPAPAALVLALTGIPALGVGALLRRRQSRKAA